MKIKIANVALLIGSISVADLATANEVQVFTNKPAKVTYRIARQDNEGQPEYDPPQSASIDKELTVAIDNKGRKLSGLELLTVNGHVLPDGAHRFNQPKQCSMTTDKNQSAGIVKLTTDENKLSCETIGGVFGK